MEQKYKFLFFILCFIVAMKIYSSEYVEQFPHVDYYQENSTIDNGIINYFDIGIIQSKHSSLSNSNFNENSVNLQQHGSNNNISNMGLDEYDSIVICDNFLSENNDNFDEENKLTPFDNYAQFFTNEWEKKEIVLDAMQHETLGMRWHKKISEPLNTLNHFINNKQTTGINIQTNLSILRIISNLVKTYLREEKFDDLKGLFVRCQEHQIHWWTSPYIEKSMIEKIKKGEHVVQPENMIRDAFEQARKKLFLSIREAMCNNTSEQKILSDDVIRKMRVLYALTVMAREIHVDRFDSYEKYLEPLQKIQESDVLLHVDSGKASLIWEERTKKLYQNSHQDQSWMEIEKDQE